VDDDDIQAQDETDIAVIEPTPWFNSDTVATSMMFAANLAQAAAAHFQNLALLAIGQSAHEWVLADRADFVDGTQSDIDKLLGKEESGG